MLILIITSPKQDPIGIIEIDKKGQTIARTTERDLGIVNMIEINHITLENHHSPDITKTKMGENTNPTNVIRHALVIPLNRIEIDPMTDIETLQEIDTETTDQETDLTREIETPIEIETVIIEVIHETEIDPIQNPIPDPIPETGEKILQPTLHIKVRRGIIVPPLKPKQSTLF
jgi:hypothetical protein